MKWHQGKNSDASFKTKFKTEICKFWEINKNCKFGDSCAFAHGDFEMRKKHMSSSNYKTRKCKQFFEVGYCPYGSRCQFQHHELFNEVFSYKKALLLYDTPDYKEYRGYHKIARLKIFDLISMKEIEEKERKASLNNDKLTNLNNTNNKNSNTKTNENEESLYDICKNNKFCHYKNNKSKW